MMLTAGEDVAMITVVEQTDVHSVIFVRLIHPIHYVGEILTFINVFE